LNKNTSIICFKPTIQINSIMLKLHVSNVYRKELLRIIWHSLIPVNSCINFILCLFQITQWQIYKISASQKLCHTYLRINIHKSRYYDLQHYMQFKQVPLSSPFRNLAISLGFPKYSSFLLKNTKNPLFSSINRWYCNFYKWFQVVESF
jgi:hypothetical protein